MEKVLVVGSEGSLMQAVIPKLIAKGYKVFGVDNLQRWKKRGEERGYEFARIDMSDPFSADLAFEQAKPDYVIQAAARIYGVNGFHSRGADILGQDVMIQTNVLSLAKAYNVKRVVYISSSMVYEGIAGRESVWESDILPYSYPPTPASGYGLSKLVGERLCYEYQKQYNLDYTIWRPFNIITGKETSEGELGTSHVFADFFENILVKKLNPLPIIGKGTQVRCFTWIDEVADAIATHSFSGVTKNDTFNLGRDEPVTMTELALKIYEEAQKRGHIPEGDLELKTEFDVIGDVSYRRPYIFKTQRHLGWVAKQDLDTSISSCMDEWEKRMSEKDKPIITLAT